MLIRFLRDYRGTLTAEHFFRAGETVDLERGAAIVAEGAAEPAAPEPDPALLAEVGDTLVGAEAIAEVLAPLVDADGAPLDVPPGDLAADLAQPAPRRGRRA